MSFRIEQDSIGKIKVPSKAYYGAQTQRAIQNFEIGWSMEFSLILPYIIVKKCAAKTNYAQKNISKKLSDAIIKACNHILDNPDQYLNEFPVPVFQTGSGTQTNMNVNEVVANKANEILGAKLGSYKFVHPNDHVNMSQSTNDTFPTAILVGSVISSEDNLLPALTMLERSLVAKSKEFHKIIKVGRTHLQDATPIRLGQEFSGYASMIKNDISRIKHALKECSDLPVGGTAVGTGINAHPDFAEKFVKNVSKKTSIDFRVSPSYFEAMSSQDSSLELSSHLRSLATCLIKISNDLRWMNSGPLAGISEIKLPDLQPGSSIMPGKVNPVIPEAVIMACAQVIGNDATIAYSAQSGNFQLNVMLPVIAYNLIQSINIMANAISSIDEKAISGFEVNREVIDKNLKRNPILITALNSKIGYELGAKIAKKAYQQNRSVKDVAMEMTDLSEDEIDQALDPLDLTEGGLK